MPFDSVHQKMSGYAHCPLLLRIRIVSLRSGGLRKIPQCISGTNKLIQVRRYGSVVGTYFPSHSVATGVPIAFLGVLEHPFRYKVTVGI